MLLGILKILGILALFLIVVYMLVALGSMVLGVLMMKSVYDELSEEEKGELKDEFKFNTRK